MNVCMTLSFSAVGLHVAKKTNSGTDSFGTCPANCHMFSKCYIPGGRFYLYN